DLDRALEFGRDLSPDYECGRAIDAALAIARDLAQHGLLQEISRALAEALNLALHPKVPFLGISDVPPRWVSGESLGRVSWAAISADRPFNEAGQIFADELISNAGIEGT